MTVETILN